MKLKGNLFIRKIGNENFAMLVGAGKEIDSKMIRCNDSSKLIFETLKNDVSISEIVSEVTKKYDIDEETAKCDVESVIAELKKNNFIEE